MNLPGRCWCEFDPSGIFHHYKAETLSVEADLRLPLLVNYTIRNPEYEVLYNWKLELINDIRIISYVFPSRNWPGFSMIPSFQ